MAALAQLKKGDRVVENCVGERQVLTVDYVDGETVGVKTYKGVYFRAPRSWFRKLPQKKNK